MKAQQCMRQRAAAKRALRPILGHGEFAEKWTPAPGRGNSNSMDPQRER
jgi:hypothetical protein